MVESKLIGRSTCALFGLLVWTVGLGLWGFAAVNIPLLYGHVMPAEVIRWLYAASGVALVMGPLAGVVRFQMKRGNSEEQLGGGGCAQICFAVPVSLLYFAVMVFPGLLILAIALLLRKDIYGNGTGIHITIVTAVSWLLLLFVVAHRGGDNADSQKAIFEQLAMIAFVGGAASSDHYLGWQIFRWGDRGRLETPASAEIPRSFHLSHLLFASLVYGAYLTGLVWVWRIAD